MRTFSFLNTTAMLPEIANDKGSDKPASTIRIASNEIVNKAEEYAGRVSEDTEADLAEYAADKENVARGPIVACNDLVDDFGDLLLDFPEPGSKEGATGNRLPDKFTRTVTIDGQPKKKPASFYSILFDGTLQGRTILSQIAALDAVKNGQAMPDKFSPELWQTYAEYGSDEILQERARLAQSRTNRRNVLVKGVRLAMQMARVNRMELVGAKTATKKVNDEDVIMNTPKPIIIYDKPWTVDSKTTLVSVDTFLAYDVDKAIAAGGKRGDLTVTASRDGSAGGGGDDKKKNTVPEIANRNMLEGFIASLATKVGTQAGKAEIAQLAAGDHARDVIISLCIIADATDSIVTKNRHVYDAYLEEQIAKKAGDVPATPRRDAVAKAFAK